LPEPAPTSAAVPILRIFDRAKAREFYVDFLGFTVDWEHGGDGSPLYTQVSRGGTVLHLSEHVVIDPFHNRLVFHQPWPSGGAD
jgi:catechol 2,3-dioxygenase-like lactoylglutathione lyase family enzyme